MNCFKKKKNKGKKIVFDSLVLVIYDYECDHPSFLVGSQVELPSFGSVTYNITYSNPTSIMWLSALAYADGHTYSSRELAYQMLPMIKATHSNVPPVIITQLRKCLILFSFQIYTSRHMLYLDA